MPWTEAKLIEETQKLEGRITAIENMQKSLEKGLKELGKKEEALVADQLALQKERAEFEAKKSKEKADKDQKEKDDADKAAKEAEKAEKEKKRPKKVYKRIFKFNDAFEEVVTVDEADHATLAQYTDAWAQNKHKDNSRVLLSVREEVTFVKPKDEKQK